MYRNPNTIRKKERTFPHAMASDSEEIGEKEMIKKQQITKKNEFEEKRKRKRKNTATINTEETLTVS